MTALDRRTAYRDAAAATKRFTNPLHMPWLDGVDRQAAVLDYGCGYGRTMGDLVQQGFDNALGVDSSPAMIARARDLHPAMRFAVLDPPPALPCADASVDVVLLFAVLTSIPGDEAQRRLIGELKRVLKPGGLLYLSAMPLQDDSHNRGRYARFAEHYGTYGVFETDDGAVCRHHESDCFASLLAGFTVADTRRIALTTTKGHESAGIQLLSTRRT